MPSDIITVPPGTRLNAVVLHDGETHVWIAVAKRDEDYRQWQGTYLRIERTGRVTRVTVDNNYDTDMEFVIREGD